MILLALVGIGTPGQFVVAHAAGAARSAPVRDLGETTAPITDNTRTVAPASINQPASLAYVSGAPTADRVAARHIRTQGDPLEGFNRAMFSLYQKLDRTIVRPAALAYRDVVPKPARSGLRNFFSNLSEPTAFLNYLLQFKAGKAIETFGRFAINSTLGIGGLFDIAKLPGARLPHRANGFADTLAFYGVKPGPYLFLPLVGPTTLRDFIGGQGDGVVLPIAIGNPFDRIEYRVTMAITTGLDRRAEADDDLGALLDGAVDPYATLRSAYLQSRQSDVDTLRGNRHALDKSVPGLGDPLDDPADLAAPMPAAPALGALPDPATDLAVGSAVIPPPADPELADPLADPEKAAPVPPIKR